MTSRPEYIVVLKASISQWDCMPSFATDALFLDNPAPTVTFQIIPSNAICRLGCLSPCHAQEFALRAQGSLLIRSVTTTLLNSWLPVAESWVDALKKIGIVDAECTFTGWQFNAALACRGLADGSNQTGLFRVTFQYQHGLLLLNSRDAAGNAPKSPQPSVERKGARNSGKCGW